METPVRVDIEYCSELCHLGETCNDLANRLKQISENINVTCTSGRQGSFEIKVNDNLVYSKMKTMALPDYEEVIANVKTAYEGGPIRQIEKQQPITCVLS